MEEVIVKTQGELDFALAVIAQHAETTYELQIRASEDKWLRISKALDDCVVEAYGSSHIRASGSSHVEAYQFAIVRRVSVLAEITAMGNAVIVDSTVEKKFSDARDWLSWWGIRPENGTAILYKAVRPNLRDFYTDSVSYQVGKEVEASDWKEPYSEECGHALHCSPILSATNRYTKDPEHVHLKCQVNIEDIHVLPTMRMPDKCRVKKLLVLGTANEDGEED